MTVSETNKIFAWLLLVGRLKFIRLLVVFIVPRALLRSLDLPDANSNEDLIHSACTSADYDVSGPRDQVLPSLSLPPMTTLPTTLMTTTSATTTTTTLPTTRTTPTTTSPTTTTMTSTSSSSTSTTTTLVPGYVWNRRNFDRAADDQLMRTPSTTQFHRDRYPPVRTAMPQPSYPVIIPGLYLHGRSTDRTNMSRYCDDNFCPI